MSLLGECMGEEFPSGPGTGGRHIYTYTIESAVPPAAPEARQALAGRFSARIDLALKERKPT